MREFYALRFTVYSLIPVLSDRTSNAILETPGNRGAGEPDLQPCFRESV